MKNRPIRGNRWISAANFGINDRKVVWMHLLDHAGDIPDFERLKQGLKRHKGMSRL
jgi:hypothetical protein